MPVLASVPARHRARAARTVSGAKRTTATVASKLTDQFAAQRYEYFKNNRQSLPPAISEHSDEIAALMKMGKPVEEAFGEIVQKYF